MNESFSGFYGLVILPDAVTVERVRSLVKQLAPKVEFQTEIPHVTLFQGQMKDLPVAEVKKLLKKLESLRGKQFNLDKLEIFAGEYLFWDVKNTVELQKAHEVALDMVKYVNPDRLKLAPHASLNLTDKQMESVKKYGHPLSGSAYLPHITIAADSKSFSLPAGFTELPGRFTVDSVQFSEMGKNGRVENLIEIK
ncbi:MAG TPA: 2'-5' RNA ligase family protein [Candidatus Udaeobacter sp.]|nr:2'-5' RNA ligase family protein [Candidatus Udaeobacter sp.]